MFTGSDITTIHCTWAGNSTKPMPSLEWNQHLMLTLPYWNYSSCTTQWTVTLKVCVHMLTRVYRVWDVRNAVSTTQGRVTATGAVSCSNKLVMPTFITGTPISYLYQVQNALTFHPCLYKLLHIHHKVYSNEKHCWMYIPSSTAYPFQ